MYWLLMHVNQPTKLQQSSAITPLVIHCFINPCSLAWPITKVLFILVQTPANQVRKMILLQKNTHVLSMCLFHWRADFCHTTSPYLPPPSSFGKSLWSAQWRSCQIRTCHSTSPSKDSMPEWAWGLNRVLWPAVHHVSSRKHVLGRINYRTKSLFDSFKPLTIFIPGQRCMVYSLNLLKWWLLQVDFQSWLNPFHGRTSPKPNPQKTKWSIKGIVHVGVSCSRLVYCGLYYYW